MWVRVPSVPASSTTTIWMWYGNAAAASDDDPYCTFSFYEGFEDPTLHFTTPCGDLTSVVGGGVGSLSWGSSGLLVSDVALPMARVYVGEAQVTAASGQWPRALQCAINGSHRTENDHRRRTKSG